MYYFRINKRQQQLLVEIFKKNKIDFRYYFCFEYFVLENDLDVNKCFNCILDYYVTNGLLPNDEPSKYGLEIEKLNQIINHQLVLNNSENEYAKKNKTIYLAARTIFLSCDGKIDNLDEKTKKIYDKYSIPNWLEENWLNFINNKKLAEKIRDN